MICLQFGMGLHRGVKYISAHTYEQIFQLKALQNPPVLDPSALFISLPALNL